MKTGIIIQVRMGSTRFPGKVLKPLPKLSTHRPVLRWVIEACQQTEFQVYVATSTNKEDDAIASYVENWRETEFESPILFRGEPIDVLDRLYQCAKLYGLDEIVRVTGDCPFIDPDVIKQVVALRRMHAASYASNVDPPMWPDGLDTQCVTFHTLETAWKEATDPTDRDTVLQYIVHRRREFTVVNLPCPLGDLSGYRWVLDTEEDYKTLGAMAYNIIGSPSGLPRRWTDLLSLNAGEAPIGSRNERYLSQRTAELSSHGSRSFRRSHDALASALTRQPYAASTYSKSHVAWGDGAPLFLTHAQGSRVFDVDGNEFIDMTAALGTTILGHADSSVRAAIERQLDRGIAFPVAHDIEAVIARKVSDRIMPGASVVFGKNGSDVTSAAVRVAKVHTGRRGVIALEAGYHGWHDWALWGTSRDTGWGTDSSMCTRLSLKEILDIHPVAFYHWGAVIVEPDQLTIEEHKLLDDFCERSGMVLIFDEMMTAFRYPSGTFASSYGLTPDLICLGKALGNGMPITALVGRSEIMNRFVEEPGRPNYAFYSGTHLGETLSLAAAGAVLDKMDREAQSSFCYMAASLSARLKAAWIDLGSNDLGEIKTGALPRITFKDPKKGAQFRREMAHHGVLVYSLFLPTLAHSPADLDHVERALRSSLEAVISGTARGGDDIAARGIMRS